MGKTPLSYFNILMTYISFFNLVLLGHIRDQLGKIFTPWNYVSFFERNGVPPFFTTFDSFFIRRLYQRIADCWSRPVTGVPGITIKILERVSNDNNETFELTGEKIEVLNAGSYNYLGFAKNKGPIIENVLDTLDKYEINNPSLLIDHNEIDIVEQLETEIAKFLNRDACMILPMGYATNTSSIPIIMNNSLIFSDELNHMSLIKGMKLSGSEIVVFNHNSMSDLESKLKYHISRGQLNKNTTWNKIFVVVEGLYSMEGTIVDLVQLVQLKKKYKFYIYMDEAHSIGAIGKTGRGICEHLDVNYLDVDILMGTFSKSFVGFGGYITGDYDLIKYLKNNNEYYKMGERMSPVVAAQILYCLREIIIDKTRIERLQLNNRKLRRALQERNFYLLGDRESAIVPILIPSPGKIGEFSRLCLDRGLAVVVVGYPATPVLLNRVRLCVSSTHTNEDLDFIVKTIDDVGRVIGMKK